jgi:hypothetical protein
MHQFARIGAAKMRRHVSSLAIGSPCPLLELDVSGEGCSA